MKRDSKEREIRTVFFNGMHYIDGDHLTVEILKDLFELNKGPKKKKFKNVNQFLNFYKKNAGRILS